MKEVILSAYEEVKNGNPEAAVKVMEEIQGLPRTEEGLFDLSLVDENPFVAGALVYPIYAAVETRCNSKNGYPDLLEQMRIYEKKLKEDYTFENASACADMLIHTADYVSQEVYEYYRELVDMFRNTVRACITAFYQENCFPGEDAGLRDTIAYACEKHILLAEKYKQFC